MLSHVRRDLGHTAGTLLGVDIPFFLPGEVDARIQGRIVLLEQLAAGETELAEILLYMTEPRHEQRVQDRLSVSRAILHPERNALVLWVEPGPVNRGEHAPGWLVAVTARLGHRLLLQRR